MLVTSVSPAAHMHRRAARSDVAAALLRAGSVTAALLRAARALSVQNRYANEWDVQKRHGSEQGGGRCGARGEQDGTARRTVRRAAWRGEQDGAARRAAQRNAAYRQRKAPACGDTRAPGERVRGHDAPG